MLIYRFVWERKMLKKTCLLHHCSETYVFDVIYFYSARLHYLQWSLRDALSKTYEITFLRNLPLPCVFSWSRSLIRHALRAFCIEYVWWHMLLFLIRVSCSADCDLPGSALPALLLVFFPFNFFRNNHGFLKTALVRCYGSIHNAWTMNDLNTLNRFICKQLIRKKKKDER